MPYRVGKTDIVRRLMERLNLEDTQRRAAPVLAIPDWIALTLSISEVLRDYTTKRGTVTVAAGDSGGQVMMTVPDTKRWVLFMIDAYVVGGGDHTMSMIRVDTITGGASTINLTDPTGTGLTEIWERLAQTIVLEPRQRLLLVDEGGSTQTQFYLDAWVGEEDVF